MANVRNHPWLFSVLMTAVSGVIWVIIGAGFFERTVLEAGILGIACGLAISFTFIYLEQVEARETH